MISKKDPICGMQGTIKAHGHYFCSQHCVNEFEKRKGKSIPKWPFYVLVGISMTLLIVLLRETNTMLLFMGIFFIAVSFLKMADWKGFANAFAMYDIVAMRARGYALIYPLIELVLGILFLIGQFITAAAWVTLVVMAVGTVGVARNLMRKNPVRCACLGTLIKIPLTHFTLLEDIAMAVMAAMILFGI